MRGRGFGDSRRRRGQVRPWLRGLVKVLREKTFSGMSSCRCCKTHDRCYDESRKVPGCTEVGDLPYIIDYKFTCSNLQVACSGEDAVCRDRVYFHSCGCVITHLMLLSLCTGARKVTRQHCTQQSHVITTFPNEGLTRKNLKQIPKTSQTSAAKPLCPDSPVLPQPPTMCVKPPSASATEWLRTASLSTPTTPNTRTWTLNTASTDSSNN